MWKKFKCPVCGRKKLTIRFMRGDGLFSDMDIAHCSYCGLDCTKETLEYVSAQPLRITPKEIAERILEG